jgi:hypothetical protein
MRNIPTLDAVSLLRQVCRPVCTFFDGNAALHRIQNALWLPLSEPIQIR